MGRAFLTRYMAKTLTSAIGVDLGRYSLKAVTLQKKSGRIVVADCASQAVDDSAERTPLELGRQIKALFKQLGGGSKACAVAISSPEALLRIVEQPDTPPEMLRDAMRLNGVSLFNQDCRDYVLDCDYIATQQPLVGEFGAPPQKRYLVAGLPREQVDTVGKLMSDNGGGTVAAVQLAPISLFNAFEFAQPEVFGNQAFFLLDFGHTTSTMIMGSKRELVLIRTVDFGGRALVESLSSLSGESQATVIKTLECEDELMIENTRLALNAITREIGSSIGFFEGRHEETVRQVWVSGGLAKSKVLLRLLSEELHLPCQAWSAAAQCDVAVPGAKRAQFTEQMPDFSVACGVATQLLIA
jgi:Tfp pilus assembly PilM family ATPase